MAAGTITITEERLANPQKITFAWTAGTAGVLTPNTAGAIDQVPRIAWLCPIGTIKATFSAATTGLIMWYMVYKPLGPSSTVTAAA